MGERSSSGKAAKAVSLQRFPEHTKCMVPTRSGWEFNAADTIPKGILRRLRPERCPLRNHTCADMISDAAPELMQQLQTLDPDEEATAAVEVAATGITLPHIEWESLMEAWEIG